MKKYTLVTGASSGIGKAIAHKFAAKGHNLIIVARREELLADIKNEIKKEYGVDVITRVVDLSIITEVQKLWTSVKEFEVDVLINNAGFGDIAPNWEADVDKMNAMVNLNVQALMTLSLLYTKDYKDKTGTLINVSSIGGYEVGNMAAVYCASKFFVSAFTEGVAQELKNDKSKLRAKVLAPAVTKTEFLDVATETEDFDYSSFNKFHTPEEMAQFTYDLFESDRIVGIVNSETYEFELDPPKFKFRSIG